MGMHQLVGQEQYEEEKTMLVGVYGTLKYGHERWNTFLQGKAVFKFMAMLGGHVLLDKGAYPAALKVFDERYRILVEVYEVSKDTLDQLDQIEGVARNLFHRTWIENVRNPAEGFYMYREPHRELRYVDKYIPGGIWAKNPAERESVFFQSWQHSNTLLLEGKGPKVKPQYDALTHAFGYKPRIVWTPPLQSYAVERDPEMGKLLKEVNHDTREVKTTQMQIPVVAVRKEEEVPAGPAEPPPPTDIRGGIPYYELPEQGMYGLFPEVSGPQGPGVKWL